MPHILVDTECMRLVTHGNYDRGWHYTLEHKDKDSLGNDTYLPWLTVFSRLPGTEESLDVKHKHLSLGQIVIYLFDALNPHRLES